MAIFTGDSSNNVLNGTVGDDELYGYAGDDILFGGDGNDIDKLFGGLGNDTLKGSRGKDLFIFNDPNLSIYKDASNNYHVFSFEGHDIITNYSEAEGDAIIILGSQGSPGQDPIPPHNTIPPIAFITLGETLQYTINSNDLMLTFKNLQDSLHNNQSQLSADAFGFEL